MVCRSSKRRHNTPHDPTRHPDSRLAQNELVKTEFFNDFLRPNNLFNGFGISLFNDRRFSFLSIVRSPRAGAPSEEELRLLGLLTPHVQRALQLHEHLAAVHLSGDPINTVLDRLRFGFLAVGRDRSIVHMNRMAAEICAKRDGFWVDRDGLCHAGSNGEQKRFEALIDGAVGKGEHSLRAGGAASASRPSARPAYSMLVAPLPIPRFDLGVRRPAAMVLISDPDMRALVPHDLLRQLYGLTHSEAKIAIKLAQGVNLRFASEELGIRYETARSYVKSVFLKTNTHRQGELAALIGRLSGFS
jgi:DNA-binding CsgD family transcriptional regulator